jgi:hypothetical protein
MKFDLNTDRCCPARGYIGDEKLRTTNFRMLNRQAGYHRTTTLKFIGVWQSVKVSQAPGSSPQYPAAPQSSQRPLIQDVGCKRYFWNFSVQFFTLAFLVSWPDAFRREQGASIWDFVCQSVCRSVCWLVGSSVRPHIAYIETASLQESSPLVCYTTCS